MGSISTPLSCSRRCAWAFRGCCKLSFGVFRLGSLAGFVPQPVVAGFMDGIAVLIGLAQVQTMAGVSTAAGQVQSTGAFGISAGSLLLGLATALFTWFVARHWSRLPYALVGLVAGAVAYFVVQSVAPGVSLGPLLGAPADGLPMPLAFRTLAGPEMLVLVRAHLPQLLTVAFVLALVGSLDMLLTAVAVDTRLHARHDSNRLLIGHGLGNVACGAFGGLPISTSSSVQLAAHHAGGHTRVAGLVGALALLVILLVGNDVLGRIPVTVTAGVMLIVALGLLDQWSHRLWRQVRAGNRDRDTRWSLAIAVIVGATTVIYGFVVGIGVGILLSVVLFVSAMNRSLVRACHHRRDPQFAAHLSAGTAESVARTGGADPRDRTRGRDLLRHRPPARPAHGSAEHRAPAR